MAQTVLHHKICEYMRYLFIDRYLRELIKVLFNTWDFLFVKCTKIKFCNSNFTNVKVSFTKLLSFITYALLTFVQLNYYICVKNYRLGVRHALFLIKFISIDVSFPVPNVSQKSDFEINLLSGSLFLKEPEFVTVIPFTKFNSLSSFNNNSPYVLSSILIIICSMTFFPAKLVFL